MQQSGFNPEDNICWQFCNPGDRQREWRRPCQCPACARSGVADRTLVYFGRCRSGQRWFWAAYTLFADTTREATGFAATCDEAIEAAMAAVRSFRNGVPILARISHGCASRRLKQINKAKRAARPPSDAKDTPPVEYIYSWSKRFQIVKRTKQRIYYLKNGEHIDERGEPIDYGIIRDLSYRADEIGFLNRQQFESCTDKAYQWLYFPSLEALLAERERYRRACPGREPTDLAALKEAMANAHPDKGGSSAAFIEARARYVTARRMARGQRDEAAR